MSEETPAGTQPRGTRRFLLVFLGAALMIAAVISFYASSHPDGLEFVAGSTGFLDTAKESLTAHSPLAGYGVAGVQNVRLSGGVAGVIGVLVTLVLACALTWLLRRRTHHPKA
jgi:cobalt/nickel transport protein